MEASLLKYRGYMALSLVWAILLGGVLLWRQPAPAPIQVLEPTPRPTRTPAVLVVYVSGAVVRPDVYTLAESSRLKDALLAAGGPSPEADLSALNLALALQDGQQVHVPAVGEAPPPAGPQPQAAGALDVNAATAAELENLPGIGPVLAERIISYRRDHGHFAAVESLVHVPGIGPAAMEKIKPYVQVP